MRLVALLEGWRIFLRSEGYSHKTILNYMMFGGYLVGHLGDVEIADVTTEDLRAWFDTLRTEGNYAPASMYRAWVVMRALFNFTSMEGFTTKRPDHAIRRPKPKKPDIKPFTKDELRRLVDATKQTAQARTDRRKSFKMRRNISLRNQAIVLVLIDTGIRAGELVRLTYGDYNQSAGEINVRAFDTGKTRPRTLLLGGRAQQGLWKYLADRKPLYPESPLFASQRRELTYDALRQMLSELGDRAGVLKVHAHRFRHSFAYWYLINGGDAFSLQRLLGHSSFKMVDYYIQIADTDRSRWHVSRSLADRLGL